MAAVKEPAEIERIAGAADLVSVGQSKLRAVLQPGMTELELFSDVKIALEEMEGGPVELAVDLMAGARTAQVGASPTAATIESGDPVLFDLAPRRDGYWADSCATVSCGTPPVRLIRRHSAVLAALEAGLAAARPGLTAGQLDATIRATLDIAGLECPHHTGHGVGLSAQEPPWIVPGDSTPLEQGMVIALEPGAYSGGFGVRLEHLAVIEEDGARQLTDHSLALG